MPEDLSATVTDSMHKLGHQGQVNTLALIKQHFFYVNLAAQVASVALTCDLCKQTKLSKQREPNGLPPVPQKTIFQNLSRPQNT